ncbi:Protein of unknown function [Psychrobacillus psychrotolerans]|uniref:DUF3006 domain-containing protein n=1 Tax=Psychrobacillus psychrotolerans TaxID=126156 RepID=A0A1I6AMM1_9BACI|nr:DUF3006 domain-containing protein [Psychrobacillus psychrotolerans]SFQ69807.1 Protein of unknown function [Psychrobacillus psychrotolerans]
MNSNKYTLDRFEGDYAVFLKTPNETEILQILCSDIKVKLKQGDIVNISSIEDKYEIEPLVEETTNQKEKVRRLLEQLKERS